MTRKIVFLPGVPVPAERASGIDADVARLVEEIADGRVCLDAGSVVGRAPTPEEEARLNEALDAILAPP